jgi:N-acetylglucosaminyldiphosphoundecaprenol N-acetyl-beta-D-mannosaminyltransferase
MKKYFNIFLEFDHKAFNNTIKNTINSKTKGYVCVVDANVLTMAQSNLSYLKVINEAMVNTCDGSSIASMAGMIHKQNFRALNGPQVFEKYIEKEYIQLLLGSTKETSNRIKNQLSIKGIKTGHLKLLPLPFLDINEFDFKTIAKEINLIKPDIIWVSLGAPKQEVFMNRILPYLDKGVMFGIGAAFNFYVGDLGMPTFHIGGLRFIWLNRLINEPRKLIKRIVPYILIIPRLYLNELKKSKQLKRTINIDG